MSKYIDHQYKNSKALHTQFFYVYGRTGLPQQKKSIAHYMVEWLLGARKSQSLGVMTVPHATSVGGSKSQKFYFVKIV